MYYYTIKESVTLIHYTELYNSWKSLFHLHFNTYLIITKKMCYKIGTVFYLMYLPYTIVVSSYLGFIDVYNPNSVFLLLQFQL
jgi:hypothetical protein